MFTSAKTKRIVTAAVCLMLTLCVVSSLAETARVTGYMVRLRASASTKARILDAFPNGTVVTILNKNGTWTKVRVRGKTGYMMTSYLSIRDSGNGGGDGRTMYVDTGSSAPLHLREEPSVWSFSLGKFKNGTAVTVLRRGSAWTKVRVNGLVGYMGSQYLSSTR